MLNQILTSLLHQWTNKAPLESSREFAIDSQLHEWAEYVVVPEAVALSTQCTHKE